MSAQPSFAGRKRRMERKPGTYYVRDKASGFPCDPTKGRQLDWDPTKWVQLCDNHTPPLKVKLTDYRQATKEERKRLKSMPKLEQTNKATIQKSLVEESMIPKKIGEEVPEEIQGKEIKEPPQEKPKETKPRTRKIKPSDAAVTEPIKIESPEARKQASVPSKLKSVVVKVPEKSETTNPTMRKRTQPTLVVPKEKQVKLQEQREQSAQKQADEEIQAEIAKIKAEAKDRAIRIFKARLAETTKPAQQAETTQQEPSTSGQQSNLESDLELSSSEDEYYVEDNI